MRVDDSTTHLDARAQAASCQVDGAEEGQLVPKLTSWFASVIPGRRSKYSRSSRAGSISISFGAGLAASGEMVMSAPSCYGTGHGFAFQISAAYSAMVRSLENFPDPAIFRITLRAHASPSEYNSQSRRSASRYDLRSARCM